MTKTPYNQSRGRMNLTVLPVARVQFPAMAEYFKGVFHTLPTRPEPAWQKMAQSPLNDTTMADSDWKCNQSTSWTLIETNFDWS